MPRHPLLLLALAASFSACKQDLSKDTSPVEAGCDAPTDWYTDADGDGYGSAAAPTSACEPPDGAVADSSDCDDSAAAVHPGAAEIWYDGADEDCSGGSDFDQDGDGYNRDDECDDLDPTRYPDPSVTEVWYDGVDDNCDGNDGDQDGDGWYEAGYPYEVPERYALLVGDCWDDPAANSPTPILNGFPAVTAPDVHPGASETWYDGLDADCAGDDDFDADADASRTAAWPDERGFYGDDCVDDDPTVHPGAAETWYDGIDADCAGDDDYDQDGDGYDVAEGEHPGDCDDTDPLTSPAATETCDGPGDEDCDGVTDEPDADGCTLWYKDDDSDSYGGASECLCDASDRYTVAVGGDCDDGSDEIHPGATELCDGVDEDCDGSVDNGLGSLYNDNDHDGYGDAEGGTSCTGVTTDHSDCDDGMATVHPTAPEVCDAIDEDCDGFIDEGLATAYPDADGDSYGDADATPTCSGTTSDHSDCDDTTIAIHPGASEACNSIDDDCDGSVDEGLPTLYPDLDGDHFGDASGVPSCTSGVAATGDCNDYNAAINPAATELCNAIDDDCDGSVDEGTSIRYTDNDHDGQGTGSGTCSGSGATTGGDCDDTDPLVYTGAPELCDLRQNDCGTAWTAASEVDHVSELAGDGTWTDLSSAFLAGTAASPVVRTLREGATLYVCPGTWFTHLAVPSSLAQTSVIGPYGSADTVLHGADSGTVVNAAGASGLDLTLQGVTITHGYAAGGGGGVSVGNANVTIDDVVFSENVSSTGGGALYLGGGDAWLNASSFSSNAATNNGGAIDAHDVNLRITSVVFDSNSAGPAPSVTGGALAYNSTTSHDLEVVDSSFSSNTASATASSADGGAIYVFQSGSGSSYFEGNDYTFNQVTSSGGSAGVALGGATCGYFGGSGPVTFQSETLTGNLASGDSQSEGGAYLLNVSGSSTVDMDDLLVQGNYTYSTSASAYGGGLCYLGTHAGDASLSNSTFGGNANYSTTYTANGIGGGVYLGLTGTSFTVDATTLDRNTASFGALAISTADSAHVSIQGGSTISNSVGYGIYQSASDLSSDVALTDSSVQGSSSTGWYMTAPRAVGVHASCTGSSGAASGIWGNGGYGALQTCTTAASCTFTAVQCDFNDPSTGTGNSSADVYANGYTYNYTYDASFVCIGSTCL